jgi:hypothetical protein
MLLRLRPADFSRKGGASNSDDFDVFEGDQSAARRCGLSPMRSSVRSIIVLAAATSS